MSLSTGIHHVAVLTTDLDRFLEFYCGVFDAAVIFDLTEDGLRHAAVDLGAGAGLHAFQVDGNPHAAGSATVFDRGHLDHLAVAVPDEAALQEARRRLVAAGAADGTVVDFGSVRTVSFRDPDGLEAEVALWCDAPVRTFAQRVVEPGDDVPAPLAGTAPRDTVSGGRAG